MPKDPEYGIGYLPKGDKKKTHFRYSSHVLIGDDYAIVKESYWNKLIIRIEPLRIIKEPSNKSI